MVYIAIATWLIFWFTVVNIAKKKWYTKRKALLSWLFIPYSILYYIIIPTTNKKIAENKLEQERIMKELQAKEQS
jgi:hypothetical protein